MSKIVGTYSDGSVVSVTLGDERSPMQPVARDSEPSLPLPAAQILIDAFDSAAALGLHTPVVGALSLTGQPNADALHTWAERHGRDIKVTPLACGSIHYSCRVRGFEILVVVLATANTVTGDES